MRLSSSLIAAAVLCTPAVAQGADECVNAVDLGTGSTAFLFDTNVCSDTGTQATTSAEVQCASFSNDVWVKFTASMTGLATIDTCNNATFDTEIAVWEGGDCSSFLPLGCNDDNGAAGCTGLTSLITVPVTAGTVYHVAVGYWSGTATVWGAGTLTITEFPSPCTNPADDSFEPNDICAAPSAITSGTFSGLFCSLSDPDFYRITLQPNEILDVTVVDTATTDLNLNVLSSSCAQLVTSTSDTIRFSSTGATGPVTVVVEVYVNPATAGFGCLDYDMTVAVMPDPCAGAMDDSFEPNDFCTAPSAITPGQNTGLFCSLADPDFYQITLQPNEILSVAVVDTLAEDLDLNLLDSACSLITFFNADAFTYTNTTGAVQTVVFEIFVDPTTFSLGCLNYDMSVSSMIAPDCTMPDVFEDSDDCLSAMPLGDGIYAGLNVEDGDNDFYEVGLDAGAMLTVDIFFTDTFSDVDLYLWDPLVACDTSVAGTGTGSGALAIGFSTTDNEQVVYTNSTGGPQTLIVEVDMFTASGCNAYDLMISGSNGMGGSLGMNYCMTNPNSTGATSEIAAIGSRVSANNDVTLVASNLPNSTFGFFIVSQTQGFVPNPNSSMGNLCLSGAIGRYVGPGQIQNTMNAGGFSLPLNLMMTPQPNGFVMVSSGQTWNYQAWHRDSTGGSTTSNFTDGLSIMYL